jgi:hypothetical protein
MSHREAGSVRMTGCDSVEGRDPSGKLPLS